MTTPPTAAVSAAPRGRLGYIDWTRGLAILVMINAHVVDSYTRVGDKASPFYQKLVFVHGLAAPLFLFLAGLSVVLAAEARTRKTGDRAAAFRSVARRGWEVLGFAFLFRLQSYLLNPGVTPLTMLKVDILNVMGPSMVLAAVAWRASASRVLQVALLGAGMLAMSALTPVVRASTWLGVLPDPLEWYFRPRPGSTGFTFFPWTAFLLGGALTGLLVGARWAKARGTLLHVGLAAGGVLLVVVGNLGWRLPWLYGQPYGWSLSPSFFFVRLGLVVAMLGLAYFWELRPARMRLWQSSPMREFGHSSLFVYFVHVELVYGWFSQPLKRSMPVWWALVAFLVVTVGMFYLSRLKDRLMARWRQRRAPAVAQA